MQILISKWGQIIILKNGLSHENQILFDVIGDKLDVPAGYFRVWITLLHVADERLLEPAKDVLIISEVFFYNQGKIQEVLYCLCILFRNLLVRASEYRRNRVIHEWHYRLSQAALTVTFLVWNWPLVVYHA